MTPDDIDHDDEEFDPEQAERDIQAFLDAAEALGGPPVPELAAAVAAIVAGAWADVERVMAGVGTNKVIATMLLVSRQARACTPDEPRQWQLHAASTLLTGLTGQDRQGGGTD